MSIEFHIENQNASIIKVIGVGGGGGNAVNNMFHNGITGVDFIICNTDSQVLDKSPIPHKVQLGAELTSGLGAGSNPEVGKNSALENLDEIKSVLADQTKMVFVTAGMGGGTGTGAAPVIAQLAKEMGILTVGIVTTPFDFEGEWRKNIAYQGLAELEQAVDTLLVINNNSLLKICPKNISMRDAFFTADQVLCNAAKGIAEIITVSGYINVDFADVQTIMRDSGTALMGMATKIGKDRAQQCIEEALNSPLLDNVDINGATGILVNITTSPEYRMTVEEYGLIGEIVRSATGGRARTIIGSVDTADCGEAMTITVIATGFRRNTDYASLAQKDEPINIIRKSVESPTPTAVSEVNKIPVKKESPEPARVEKQEVPVQKQTVVHSKNEPLVRENEHPPIVRHESYRRNTVIYRSIISPEDRISRMNHSPVDIHNGSIIKEYEDVPAYERRRENIDIENKDPRNRMSNYSVKSGGGGNLFRDNNAYLYDNVD
jgi:cell division protein FtsZ